MMWVRVDCQVHQHRKTRAAGKFYLEALGLWVASLSHCNLHTTDGVIRKDELRMLCPVDAVPLGKLKRLATLLVQLKRWSDEGDFWLVHGYADEQELALSHNVELERELWRTKKRRQRETSRANKLAKLAQLSLGDTSGDSQGTHGGSPQPNEGAVPRESQPTGPYRTVPDRSQEEEGRAAPPLPPPPPEHVEAPDMGPTARLVLTELRRHPELTREAVPAVAEQVAAYELSNARSPAQLVAAVGEVAQKLRLEEATGQSTDARTRLNFLLGACKIAGAKPPTSGGRFPRAAPAPATMDPQVLRARQATPSPVGPERLAAIAKRRDEGRGAG